MKKYVSILALVSTSILANPTKEIKAVSELNALREANHSHILHQLLSSPSLKKKYDSCIKVTNKALLNTANSVPMNHQSLSVSVKKNNCFTLTYSDISSIKTLKGSSIQIPLAADVLMTSISMEYISKGYKSTIVGTGNNETPITQIKLTF